MSIQFHESTKTFHLFNAEVSYIIKVLESGHLAQLYYGKKVNDKESYDYLFEQRARPMSVCSFEGNLDYSLEHIKQECPIYGYGDMHLPSIDVVLNNGSRIIDLKYNEYQIVNGKPKIESLPATYVEEDDEAQTLQISLFDEFTGIEVILSYTIFQYLPVITRHMKIINHSLDEIDLQKVMSMSLDLPDKDYEMIELTGAWSRERHVQVEPLHYGVQSVYSLRGCSSHHFNPFIALKRSHCNEYYGEVYGFSLVYSGNFLAQVDVDPYDVTRVMMGIHPQNFSWKLAYQESFVTPEVVMVYTDKGLNDMSQCYHHLYQRRLARGRYRDKERPILINNWEATYFDFNEDKLLKIIKEAKNLGIELFVLDDGWFTHRHNDQMGLGDWDIDYNKLENGLQGLSKKVRENGLEFGLWIEPEMVNKGTDLFRDHPEWVLHIPKRKINHGRHQFVLDFSNQEVIDYLFDKLSYIFKEASLTYVKWDMNRSMSDVFSLIHEASDQGKIMHLYILGLYQLYERLIEAFPDILFESCASGGGRFDPGMLYYAPQCWASDDTDAMERIKIQYGTSYVYPLSCIGSHVSDIPNHQVYRNTPLHTRANVAYFGTFGYELDLTKLTSKEKKMIKEQVRFMKEYRHIIQFGYFYRLKSPFEGNEAIWMVVSKDRNIAIVGYYRFMQEVNVGYRRVRLKGLDEDKLYHVSILDEVCFGSELMNIGLLTTDASSGENKEKEGDYISRLYILRCNE